MFAYLALGCALAAPASCTCSGSDSGAKPSSSALAGKVFKTSKDVCEFRGKWEKRMSKECSTCLSVTTLPACACPLDTKDYSGVCLKKAREKKKFEKECAKVFACANGCRGKRDCDCYAKCYEGHDKCQEAAVVVDTCVAEACHALCK